MPFDNERHPANICDGCRGKKPEEHKCHGENAGVLGFKTNKPCECRICAEKASYKKSGSAELLRNWGPL